MRHVVVAIVLVAGCKGEAKMSATKPPPQDASVVTKVAEDAAPADAPPIALDAAPPAQKGPRWQSLFTATEELQNGWAQLPAEKQFSFYQDWTRKADALSAELREEGDAEELTELAEDEALPPTVRAEADEGYYFALYVSEAWLLRTFPSLPEDERAYLQWLVDMGRDHWFAEGGLEVSVEYIANGYKQGLTILQAKPDTWRKSDIERTLGAIVSDLGALLWQSPAPYKAKRYHADIRKAFEVVAKGGPHAKVAEAILKAFPVKGMPYDSDDVDAVLEAQGLLD